MRMEVDEAWRDDKSACVDFPCRPGIRQSSNGRDAVAADPDVGGERRIARAIDDAPAADQEVVGALLRAPQSRLRPLSQRAPREFEVSSS